MKSPPSGAKQVGPQIYGSSIYRPTGEEQQELDPTAMSGFVVGEVPAELEVSKVSNIRRKKADRVPGSLN